jgi:hypothetical protein
MGSILLDFDCKGNRDFTLAARAEWANRGAVLRRMAVDGTVSPFEATKSRIRIEVTLV